MDKTSKYSAKSLLESDCQKITVTCKMVFIVTADRYSYTSILPLPSSSTANFIYIYVNNMLLLIPSRNKGHARVRALAVRKHRPSTVVGYRPSGQHWWCRGQQNGGRVWLNISRIFNSNTFISTHMSHRKMADAMRLPCNILMYKYIFVILC